MLNMDNKDKQGHVFVFGAARVGKSKFIETAVNLSREETIILSSPQLRPHTSDFSFHEAFGMHWCNMPGFLGDEGHNDVILNAIQAAQRAPIYPPLIIIRTLNQAELLWTEGLAKMFSSVVIAVRCDDFSSIPEQVARFNPLQVFHIPEFMPRFAETIVDYEQSIQLIVEFYQTLEPRRQNINFDHRLFSGEIIEQEAGVEEGTVERQEVERSQVTWEAVHTTPEIKSLQKFSKMAYSKFLFWEWDHKPVYYKEDVVVEVPIRRQITADLITIKTFRDSRRRTKIDVYKRLTAGPLVFVGTRYTEWEIVRSDQIAARTTRADELHAASDP